jgi:hypothetical protein
MGQCQDTQKHGRTQRVVRANPGREKARSVPEKADDAKVQEKQARHILK